MEIIERIKIYYSRILSYSSTHKSELLLAGIVLLALVVRVLGFTWGIGISNSHPSYHPDEDFVVRALKQIDWRTLDFNPEQAHVEGTFYYYAVAGAGLAFRIIEKTGLLFGIHVFPTSLTEYTTVVLLGRLLSIAFGVLTVFLLYKIVVACKLPKQAALLAALVLAVFPIDIMYSQFLRPHIFANTLLVFGLLLLYSDMIKKKKLRYALVGIFIGLSTATRYNMAIAMIIPGLFVLIESIENKKSLLQIIFNKYLYILGGTFLFGFFLGDPYMLISYSSVKPFLDHQRSFVEPGAFALKNLTNIGYPLRYISYLIPEAGKPFLAIGIYLSVLIALMNKDRFKYSVPLVAFVLIYTYMMGKGYAQPIFARAVLPMLPVFGILVAVAFTNIHEMSVKPIFKKIFPYLIIVLSLCSLIFVWRYYAVINNTQDSRDQLYIQLKSRNDELTYIQKGSTCRYYIGAAIREKMAIVQQVDPADMELVLTAKRKGTRAIICTLDKTTEIKTAKLLEMVSPSQVTLISRNQSPLITMEMPHDMLYPFTVFYLIEF